MDQTKAIGITVAILSAAKLILESFQVDLIDDNFINACTNIVAAGLTIWGIWKNHRKPKVKEVIINEFRAPIDPSA